MTAIMWLDDVRGIDASNVGEKAGVLGEIGALHVAVPIGFVVTADPYRDAMRVGSVGVPPELRTAVAGAYRQLGERLGRPNPSVVVRSSVVGDDASFASTAAASRHVVGLDALIEAISRCWASLSNEGACVSRAALGRRPEPAMAVIVQEMVPLMRSGEALTVDPVCRRDDVLRITAMFGRGEDRRTGLPALDTYLVCRQTNEVIETQIGTKTATVVGGPSGPVIVPIGSTLCHPRVLTDSEAARLADIAMAIERRFSHPQSIEWCLGASGTYWILRSRPITLGAETPRQQEMQRNAS